MAVSTETVMAIKTYQNQAEALVKHYLLADPFIPYTSVLGGIFACKVAYDLTHLISTFNIKVYNGLTKIQRIEWNNRGMSTVHAVFITAISLYFVFWSDLFSDQRHAGLVTLRSSQLSTVGLGVSIGYFFADLGMISLYYPTLGGKEYVIHHSLSTISVAYSMLSGELQLYTYMCLISEVTTPEINMRWYLDTAGLKRSAAYLINGLAIFLAWLMARILLFLYLFYHIYSHYDQVFQMSPFGSLLAFLVPAVLFIMNLMWFGKIMKGLKKTLAKRHDFTAQRLRGVIPPETANLLYLETLNLSVNELHGTIPSSFRNLSRLTTLVLRQNNLEGPIPNVIGDMKSLNYIDLSENWFNGSIPAPVFASLPLLQSLYLGNNLLSGGIPPEFGNITTLVQLDLSDNHLSGVLPHELGSLVNLTGLWLINNEFSGELPKSLAALEKMATLFITGNNFSGKIPEYMAKWKNLTVLYLLVGYNGSRGLMGNSFEGPFPDALSSLNLTALYVADLANNEGGRDFPFPNITRMTSLTWLTLRNCSITGRIPEFILQMTYLYYLDLSFNNLTGEIPNLSYNQRLKYIYLKGNKLNGSFPRWLADSTDTYVDISENSFESAEIQQGGISTNINTFACCTGASNPSMAWQRNDYSCHSDKSLNDHLYINSGGDGILTNGVYYEADSQPDGGSKFYLSEDKSWGYSSMGIFFGANHDQYTVDVEKPLCGISSDDAPLYRTARVSPISLKYYGFCMKNGKYKVKLHFAEIVYGENRDPSSKGKRLFDVAIQGKKVQENFNIREAAKVINGSVSLDFIAAVKNNRLEIHLYWSGKGSISSPMEYYGPLISAISVFPVPRKYGRKPSAMSIAALIGSVLLFPLLVVVSICKMGWLGGKGKFHSEELKCVDLIPAGSFNCRQIKAATQNFSPSNKIGEGGFGPVFKGVLPNGTAIAVKQLSSKSKQGTREFVNEVGTIFALQHPNLAKLLGCCTDDNQLLLVYEYMENNSLAHALFGPEELKLRLNWPTRFQICLGIARGLAFLHEESKLKIVHRDIKPTNVLLDKDLNAKISDFGLAKLYEAEHTHVITRIAGTTGYMAPEYAMRGYLTSKADVYSFGVVALELVSGKNGTSYRPNDESVYLLDLAYVLQEKGELISLVDPILGYDYSMKQAMIILDLAMLCTNPSPTLRPTMSEVVKILEGKSKMKAPSFNVPYSADDFAKAKAVACLIPRVRSGSKSTGRSSNAVSYDVVSREEDANGIFEDCSSEMVDKTEPE